jgi:hypothetical protein
MQGWWSLEQAGYIFTITNYRDNNIIVNSAYNKQLYNFYYQDNQIKDKKMSRACKGL